MPTSKRVKKVNLAQTSKRTREGKQNLINDVRTAIDDYDSVFLFSFDNMRSNKFKDVRLAFRDSKIFMGKNKILQISLGKGVEDEYADGLHEVSKLISGSVGLLATSRPKSEVVGFFEDFSSEDFARAGSVANGTVKLTNVDVSIHPVSMVEQFRKLGLPCEVKNGKVELVGAKEFTVVKEGREINAEQAKILVHFGKKLATFRVKLEACWLKDGNFEQL
ncbi:hypothetical protein TrVE_jg12374 [Triparma verrucosa]|uniref:Ribosome assembly factor mrt4 n=1 Tax=Triparma verrucosa TaxID=1606542 RepID=A0A9W7FBD0_9STRA|nr:hypothetical protein TrVE_jg12374 [Triparma verrucosa]